MPKIKKTAHAKRLENLNTRKDELDAESEAVSEAAKIRKKIKEDHDHDGEYTVPEKVGNAISNNYNKMLALAALFLIGTILLAYTGGLGVMFPSLGASIHGGGAPAVKTLFTGLGGIFGESWTSYGLAAVSTGIVGIVGKKVIDNSAESALNKKIKDKIKKDNLKDNTDNQSPQQPDKDNTRANNPGTSGDQDDHAAKMESAQEEATNYLDQADNLNDTRSNPNPSPNPASASSFSRVLERGQ